MENGSQMIDIKYKPMFSGRIILGYYISRFTHTHTHTCTHTHTQNKKERKKQPSNTSTANTVNNNNNSNNNNNKSTVPKCYRHRKVGPF